MNGKRPNPSDGMTEFYNRAIASFKDPVRVPFEVQRDFQSSGGYTVRQDEDRPQPRLIQSEVVAPPKPYIELLWPASGKLAGGREIGIFGTGFITDAKVFFNDIPALNVNVRNETWITCNVPAYPGIPPSGQVFVNVTVRNIESPDFEYTKTEAYLYIVGPTVISVVPNIGPGTGGTPVIINGSGFLYSSGYHGAFGGSSVSMNTISPTQLSCNTPVHAIGLVDVYVVAPDDEGQTGGLANAFTYEGPPAPVVYPNSWGWSPPVSQPAIFSNTVYAWAVVAYTSTWTGTGFTYTPFPFNGPVTLRFDQGWRAGIQTVLINGYSLDFGPVVNVINGVGNFNIEVYVNPIQGGQFGMDVFDGDPVFSWPGYKDWHQQFYVSPRR